MNPNIVALMLNYKQLSRMLGISILVIVGLLTVIFQIERWIDVITSLSDIWIWVAAVLIGVGAGLITRKKEKEPMSSNWQSRAAFQVGSVFAYLTVHYPRIKSEPGIPSPSRIRYVTNNRKKQAFPVPDFLERIILEHKTNWRCHHNERVLWQYLTQHNTVNLTDATPEDLGLRFDRNESLVSAEDNQHSDLVSKLRGHKLENLQIAFLNGFSLWHSVKRTLLLERSTKTAWLPPPCAYELVSSALVFGLELCRFLIHVHSANRILNHAYPHLHHFLI